MKRNIKPLDLITLLIVVICFLNFNTSHAQKIKKDSSCFTSADERVKFIDLSNGKFKLKLEKDILSVIRSNEKKLFKDLIKTNDGFGEKLEKHNKDLFNKVNNEIATVLKERRNTIYAEYKVTEDLQNELNKHKQKPDYQLIILIIVTAGIIGGIAKTTWSFLPEVAAELKKIEKKLEECKSKLPPVSNDGDQNTREAINVLTRNIDFTINSTLNNIEKVIDNAVQDTKAKFSTYFASIIFGIIASSLAVLALNIIDSKILEFSKTTDYLVLWGWCILGAIYAKKWIEHLYGKLASLIKP